MATKKKAAAELLPTETIAAQVRPGLIRTLVPFLVGPFSAWIAVHLGLPVEDVTDPTGPLYMLVSGAISAVFGYIYYVVARFLEVGISPKWGYILGSRKQPVYATPPATVKDREGTRRVAAGDGGASLISLIGMVLTVTGAVFLLVAAVSGSLSIVGLIMLAVGLVCLTVEGGGLHRL